VAAADAIYNRGNVYDPDHRQAWLEAHASANREHASAVREAASNASSERSAAADTYRSSAGYLGESL
jgi:hypothetical protein